MNALTPAGILEIVYDEDAIRLAALMKRFDPFRVLRIGGYEIRHANTLAWLLDPAESHGLGDLFLRAFLNHIEAKESMSAAALFEGSDANRVVVRREVKLSSLKPSESAELSGMLQSEEDDEGGSNGDMPTSKRAIDVLVEGDGWVVAIEAKVRAGEGRMQLEDYRRAVAEYAKTKNLEKFLVFLTLEGDDPSDEHWTPASWARHVIGPLELILSLEGCPVSSEVQMFLRSYLETLKRYSVDGGAQEQLAAKLARKYCEQIKTLKAQFDLLPANLSGIVERNRAVLGIVLNQAVSPLALRAEEIERVLCVRNFEVLPGAASYIAFFPRNWRGKFPEMFQGGDQRLMHVTFEVANQPSRIAVKLLVPAIGQNYQGKLADARRKLIEEIHKANDEEKEFFNNAFDRNGSPRKIADRYGSVFTRSFRIEQWNSGNALNGTLDEIDKHLPMLEGLMESSGLR